MIDIKALSSTLDYWGDPSEHLTEFMNTALESEIKKLFMDVLRASGIYVIEIPDKTSDLILPDLLCHYRDPKGNSHSLYIETKRKKKGSLQEVQKRSFTVLKEHVDIYVAKTISDWIHIIRVMCKKGTKGEISNVI